MDPSNLLKTDVEEQKRLENGVSGCAGRITVCDRIQTECSPCFKPSWNLDLVVAKMTFLPNQPFLKSGRLEV